MTGLVGVVEAGYIVVVPGDCCIAVAAQPAARIAAAAALATEVAALEPAEKVVGVVVEKRTELEVAGHM